ncbi:MAG: hypothetical protein K6E11_03970 [Bacilli bacterium]|nr:hypothetical protein [Bacilli bacterium]
MIKLNLIWLLVLILIILAFIGFITFGYISTKSESEKYSFSRHFPYEINKSQASRIFSYLCGGFAFLPLTFILPLYSDFGSLAFYSVFITCIFGLAMMSATAISNLPTSYLKPHLVLSTIVMAFAFLTSTLTTVYSILISNLQTKVGLSSGVHIALAVVSGMLAVGMLFVIFSPKLANWAKLEETVLNNEKMYTRGKFFPLAYSEWIAIGVIFLSEIIFLISTLSI